jgi:DNA-binding CsgD family transcriptional regulator/tetratricopeptide (TPR) repeat protein
VIDELAEAIAASAEAIEIGRRLDQPLRVGEDLVRHSRVLWTAGLGAEAAEAAREALAVLEVLPPGRELAMASGDLARLAMVNHRTDEAIEWAARAVAQAEQLGERAIVGHALNTMGTARWQLGDPGGEALLLEALDIAVELSNEDDVARAYTNLAEGARFSFEFEKYRGYLDQGIAFCIDHDLDSSRLCMTADRVVGQFEQGDWAGALAAADQVLDNLGLARITRIPLRVVQARVSSRRGDGPAWEVLDEALEQAEQTGELQFIVPVLAARAEAHWIAGQPDRIAPELEATYLRAVELEDSWSVGELGAWLARVGLLDQAPLPVPVPYELSIGGDWRGTSAAWAAAGFPFESAMALAESRDEDDLRAAMAIFDRLGSRPMLARVAARLRELGVTSVPRGVRASTRANPAGLTARELEVLALLEEGLRNSEIAARLCVSEKTVAHHVSAVLTKLDVGSRHDAAVVARDLLGAGT